MGISLDFVTSGNEAVSSHVFTGRNMAHFNPPQIQDNPNGWGPCAIPEQFKDMPYQPFSKGDRLGKVKEHGMVKQGQHMY
jgi:hypothetical protein